MEERASAIVIVVVLAVVVQFTDQLKGGVAHLRPWRTRARAREIRSVRRRSADDANDTSIRRGSPPGISCVFTRETTARMFGGMIPLRRSPSALLRPRSSRARDSTHAMKRFINGRARRGDSVALFVSRVSRQERDFPPTRCVGPCVPGDRAPPADYDKNAKPSRPRAIFGHSRHRPTGIDFVPRRFSRIRANWTSENWHSRLTPFALFAPLIGGTAGVYRVVVVTRAEHVAEATRQRSLPTGRNAEGKNTRRVSHPRKETKISVRWTARGAAGGGVGRRDTAGRGAYREFYTRRRPFRRCPVFSFSASYRGSFDRSYRARSRTAFRIFMGVAHAEKADIGIYRRRRYARDVWSRSIKSPEPE